VIRAFDDGEIAKAEQIQRIATAMIDAFIHCGAFPISAFKWFMSRMAVDCGPVRLPLQPPTAAQLSKLEAALESSGVWDWLSPKRSVF
jgi:N-acetylneuraminate lyase